MADRIRGRKLQRIRNQVLDDNPLCVTCLAAGRVSEATEIDHIIPLAKGGTYDGANLQGLCADCHRRKTAVDMSRGKGASTHPLWLSPSAIPLTIVCGPPAAGKSTYVRDRAAPTDVVVDLDDIARSIDPKFTPWRGWIDRDLLDESMRVRNAMLASLSTKTAGKAWFIVSAPTEREREWWQSQLGGSVTLLHPGVDECKRRAVDRGTPHAVKGVDEWEEKSRRPWAKPKPAAVKAQIGADGWPLAS